jgi:tetratricopeptide (TPR) repeat protein
VLVQTGENAAARRLYERALSIRETSLGADHPKVADALARLARLDLSAGRYAEARPLLDRALSIQQRKLGGDHPDVAATLAILAGAGRSKGRNQRGPRNRRTSGGHRSGARPPHDENARRASGDGIRVLETVHARLDVEPGGANSSRLPPHNGGLGPRSFAHAALFWKRWPLVVAPRSGARTGRIAQLADALASARQRLATAVVRGVRDDPPERYQRLLAEARRDIGSRRARSR